MPTVTEFVIGLAAAVATASFGGGIYESVVLDPRWPEKPEIIRPADGGLNRKHFWIPAHTTFELLLLCALAITWSIPSVRYCLLAALAAHVVMRGWSGFDFIPKALEFERSTSQTYSIEAARDWTARSLLRLPLDLLTCAAMFAALVALAKKQAETPTSLGTTTYVHSLEKK